jgi:hypothetical protein
MPDTGASRKQQISDHWIPRRLASSCRHVLAFGRDLRAICATSIQK